MRPRRVVILKNFGCAASVENFRRTLAEVKFENQPNTTDDQPPRRQESKRTIAVSFSS